jgi:hypothetical protein
MAYAMYAEMSPDTLKVREHVDHALFGTPLSDSSTSNDFNVTEEQLRYMSEMDERYGEPDWGTINNKGVAVNDARLLAEMDALDAVL